MSGAGGGVRWWKTNIRATTKLNPLIHLARLVRSCFIKNALRFARRRWYYEVIGKSKCAVMDTYWQTETGGHVISNYPGVTPMKPGSCTLPCYGIDTVVLDSQTGKELEWKEGEEIEGILAIKQSWPGITRTCLGDHER